MKLIFSERGWEDYTFWQTADQRMLARLNLLMTECMRTPSSGRGKPEPLRGNLSGFWSRRVDEEHRLVYKTTDEGLLIAQCRHHYRR